MRPWSVSAAATMRSLLLKTSSPFTRAFRLLPRRLNSQAISPPCVGRRMLTQSCSVRSRGVVGRGWRVKYPGPPTTAMRISEATSLFVIRARARENPNGGVHPLHPTGHFLETNPERPTSVPVFIICMILSCTSLRGKVGNRQMPAVSDRHEAKAEAQDPPGQS